jgi:SAM-dependent methyltransferase
MSDDLPSAWGQTCPRSVRLAPNALLVPASTLRALLQAGRTEEVIVTGFALEPSVRDGERVRVSGGRRARRGDLLLCEVDGWADLLRALHRSPDGSWTVALDAFPTRRTRVPADRVLGVAETSRGGLSRFLASVRLFSLRSPFAACRFAWHRIRSAPEFVDGPAADASVLEKYRRQVAGYQALGQSTLSEEVLRLLQRHLPAGGTILVGGSGTGSEAIHLARLGYGVAGFDALPEMVRVSREAAAASGVCAEFVDATLSTLDLEGRRFDAIYLTPMLYSFVAGRARRIAALERLGRHLREGGRLLFTADASRARGEQMRTALAVIRRRLRGSSVVEAGDWYTWFLTPRGDVGYSYLHHFSPGALEAEVEAAGLRVELRHGTLLVATRP